MMALNEKLVYSEEDIMCVAYKQSFIEIHPIVDISHKITNVNLTVVLDGKLGDELH